VSQRAFCVTENSCIVQFCIIVLVIIEYGVGIGSRITVNVNVKCDVKNKSIIVTKFGRQFEI
jgi:hypothetical protein